MHVGREIRADQLRRVMEDKTAVAEIEEDVRLTTICLGLPASAGDLIELGQALTPSLQPLRPPVAQPTLKQAQLHQHAQNERRKSETKTWVLRARREALRRSGEVSRHAS